MASQEPRLGSKCPFCVNEWKSVHLHKKSNAAHLRERIFEVVFSLTREICHFLWVEVHNRWVICFKWWEFLNWLVYINILNYIDKYIELYYYWLVIIILLYLLWFDWYLMWKSHHYFLKSLCRTSYLNNIY